MAEKTIGQKIKQIEGLLGTKDVNEREAEFIENMVERSNNGTRTSHLTSPQVIWIEKIWKRHYAA